MKKLQVDPCVKCGEENPSIASETAKVRITSGIAYQFLSMEATCTRCGYKWAIKPLDEIDDSEEDGRNGC